MGELLYRVTDADEVVGPVDRDRAHAEGILHRSGTVFLVRGDGAVLVQRRSRSKRTFPGVYDASAAFHVSFGETVEEAAVRELREETGVSAPVRFVGRFSHHDPPEHQIVAVFVAESDDRPRADPSESDGCEFLSKVEVDRLVREEPVTPWLKAGWPMARTRF